MSSRTAAKSAVSATQRTQPAKREAGSKVKVKVLEAHTIKGSFFVQERDQPKRGLLTGGNAPPEEKLPEIGADIEVYINSLAPPPQYRWSHYDAPDSSSIKSTKRRPKR